MNKKTLGDYLKLRNEMLSLLCRSGLQQPVKDCQRAADLQREFLAALRRDVEQENHGAVCTDEAREALPPEKELGAASKAVLATMGQWVATKRATKPPAEAAA